MSRTHLLVHERIRVEVKPQEVDPQDHVALDRDVVLPQVVRGDGETRPVLGPVDLDDQPDAVPARWG